jgi:GNAT superfamily N-acetyltransferase
MKSLRIDIKCVNALSPEIARLIQRSYEREFGNDSMIYAEPQWYIFGYLDEGLVTQVGVLQRTITIGQNPLLIGGISFLITEPEHRGRGFASIIMKEAIVFLKNELGLPFGLLTCKPRLESLYTGMGWRTIDAPNVFVQPTGNRSCGGK